MVVLEAWSHAKPVLLTPECNLPVGYERNAALRIETNPDSIARALSSLLPAPRSQLETLGAAGRRLVAERYQWPEVAHQMRAVYAWLLGGGQRPDCVITS
jgi:glycosyltransferase involved in cell wall biosynthesis